MSLFEIVTEKRKKNRVNKNTIKSVPSSSMHSIFLLPFSFESSLFLIGKTLVKWTMMPCACGYCFLRVFIYYYSDGLFVYYYHWMSVWSLVMEGDVRKKMMHVCDTIVKKMNFPQKFLFIQ